MNRTMSRVVMLVVLAVFVQVSFLMLMSYGRPAVVRKPRIALVTMPITLGDWQGEETEMDHRVTGVITRDHGTAVVNRLYRSPSGRGISLHSTTTTVYTRELRHHPNHCYQSHGSQILKEDRPIIELDDGTSFRVDLLTLENRGQRSLALYWYQFGDQIILDRAQQDEARKSMTGQKEWPPVIKVLLSMPLSSPEEDRLLLMSFAKDVYTWTREIDRQPAASDKAG